MQHLLSILFPMIHPIRSPCTEHEGRREGVCGQRSVEMEAADFSPVTQTDRGGSQTVSGRLTDGETIFDTWIPRSSCVTSDSLRHNLQLQRGVPNKPLNLGGWPCIAFAFNARLASHFFNKLPTSPL